MIDDDNIGKEGTRTLPLITIVTALSLLAIFLYSSYQLLDAFVLAPNPESEAQAAADTRRWDRALILFNPVVSLAFASAGALLGAQVQQIRVNDLKKDVKQKDQKIKDAKDALSPPDMGGAGGTPTRKALEILNR